MEGDKRSGKAELRDDILEEEILREEAARTLKHMRRRGYMCCELSVIFDCSLTAISFLLKKTKRENGKYASPMYLVRRVIVYGRKKNYQIDRDSIRPYILEMLSIRNSDSAV